MDLKFPGKVKVPRTLVLVVVISAPAQAVNQTSLTHHPHRPAFDPTQKVQKNDGMFDRLELSCDGLAANLCVNETSCFEDTVKLTESNPGPLCIKVSSYSREVLMIREAYPMLREYYTLGIVNCW